MLSCLPLHYQNESALQSRRSVQMVLRRGNRRRGSFRGDFFSKVEGLPEPIRSVSALVPAGGGGARGAAVVHAAAGASPGVAAMPAWAGAAQP